MKQIKAHIKLDGGKYLSAKNKDKIIARCTEPTDRMGNRDTKGEQYFQKWVIKKEKEGYIFREVSHNGGIGGHAATVRQLVIHALLGIYGFRSRIVVEVME